MSLKSFITQVWLEGEEEIKAIEELKQLLEELQRQENEIYIVSVQSNQ